MTLYELGQAFRTARIQRSLTQVEAARAAGVGKTLVSEFERGALTEVGALKLLALFQVVGLELLARPAGQGRTLDDIARELDAGEQQTGSALARRVRHARAPEQR
jgi:transcriptional regulator with XRE-family HTH domain